MKLVDFISPILTSPLLGKNVKFSTRFEYLQNLKFNLKLLIFERIKISHKFKIF